MSVRQEPTINVRARIPEPVIERAQRQFPTLDLSSLVRVALARLTGMDSDQFMSPLPRGPKPRKTSE